jgi:hypothetical protein
VRFSVAMQQAGAFSDTLSSVKYEQIAQTQGLKQIKFAFCYRDPSQAWEMTARNFHS